MNNIFLYGGLVMLIGGLMSVGAAALDLEVFFSHPKAQPIVNSMGRVGARIFYALLGAAFILIGLFCTYRGLQIMGVLGGGG
jgi:hypothetical protein